MLMSGMTSVTFRHLPWHSVLEAAVRAGLSAMEWGGDIHVPPGNTALAEQVRDATAAAGLTVSAYGSYYRVGCSPDGEDTFSPVLASAVALGAPVIRVWAGNRGSQEADSAWFRHVVDDTQRIAELAAQENVQVAYEFHGGTLTDSGESAVKLLRAVDAPIYSYWQPSVGLTASQRKEELQAVLPWLCCLHVFHWRGHERLALAEGRDEWAEYLALLPDEGTWPTVLEFVKNDSVEQLQADASVLHALIARS